MGMFVYVCCIYVCLFVCACGVPTLVLLLLYVLATMCNVCWCIQLYYNMKKDFLTTTALVPTSAHTGEGIPDLLMLLVQLTQRMMNERLKYLDKLQCTVLEVR